MDVKESSRWARTWYVSVVFAPLSGDLVVEEVMKNCGAGVSLISVPIVGLVVEGLSQRKSFPDTIYL